MLKRKIKQNIYKKQKEKYSCICSRNLYNYEVHSLPAQPMRSAQNLNN